MGTSLALTYSSPKPSVGMLHYECGVNIIKKG